MGKKWWNQKKRDLYEDKVRQDLIDTLDQRKEASRLRKMQEKRLRKKMGFLRYFCCMHQRKIFRQLYPVKGGSLEEEAQKKKTEQQLALEKQRRRDIERRIKELQELNPETAAWKRYKAKLKAQEEPDHLVMSDQSPSPPKLLLLGDEKTQQPPPAKLLLLGDDRKQQQNNQLVLRDEPQNNQLVLRDEKNEQQLVRRQENQLAVIPTKPKDQGPPRTAVTTSNPPRGSTPSKYIPATAEAPRPRRAAPERRDRALQRRAPKIAAARGD